MFMIIIQFPPLKEGKDEDFRSWFTRTNKEFAKAKGFRGRRLLKPVKGGNYAAVVEFESQEAFLTMHDSPAHAEAGRQVAPLFDGSPTPHFYDVLIS